jgi:hypothetical protein
MSAAVQTAGTEICSPVIHGAAAARWDAGVRNVADSSNEIWVKSG